MSGAEPRHARRTDPEVSADRRSDAELGALVRWSGDEDALGELYRRHQSAVLSYARTFARDPHTAEDLASEAFTRTLRAVRSGAGPDAAWRPYLLTVVRHTAVQWAATARRTELSGDFEQWLEERSAAYPAPGGLEYADTEERVLAREDLGLVVRGFRSLPERWQAALWHSVVEGETAERIGVLLGVSPSGVTSLTARAREGLREAYLGAHAESGSGSEECRRHGPLLAATVRRPGSRSTRQLRRHLDGCERCRHALVELTDLDRRLGAVLPAGLLLWGTHAYLSARLGASVGATGAAGPAVGSSGGGAASTASTAGGKLALLGTAAATVSALVVGGLLLTDGGEQGGKAPVAVPAPGGVTTPSAAPATPSTPSAPTSPSARPTASPSPSRTASPSPSEWLPRAEDRTRLRLAATGRCMEIPGGSGAAGLQAREAPCDGGRHQVWDLLRPGDNGRVQIRNAATGRCLANQGTETDDAPVVQTGCDPADPRQLWLLYAPEGSGEARFIQWGDRMYLGLNDWANAADGKAHTTDIGTNHHYYGSSSFGFRYDGALFDGALFGGRPSGDADG
ncbi:MULTISPECIES: sigma-70 family RNA polymerase sigma factor [unclassified Streptomyces]|uniref:sigma-70 family RNA polymerase sigma factor n=1 Tax=unclassified Streptomyces TaxID=2593676 RepID=UPI0006AF9C9C|nr:MULTISPECIES: sigma-70 family RNA polymerase sigma factor [unclassified Streptomyces]